MELTQIGPDQRGSFAAFIPKRLLAPLGSGRDTGVGVVLLGQPAAAAVLQYGECDALLLSIFVDPYLRRSGVGSFLLSGLSGCLREIGGICSLRACLPFGDERARDFFVASGWRVRELEDGVRFDFRLSDLGGSRLGLPAERGAAGGTCLPGTSVRPELIAAFERRLRAEDAWLCERSADDPAIDQALSHYFIRAGEVRGCAMFSAGREGLRFEFAHVEDEGPVFQRLLSLSLAAARARFAADTPVSLDAVSAASMKLAAGLVPNARRTPRLMAELSL